MNRIDALFSRLKNEGRRALMPFVTAGDPDLRDHGGPDHRAGQPGRAPGRGRDPLLRPDRRRAGDRRELSPGPRTRASRSAHIFQTLADAPRRGLGDGSTTTPLVTMVSYAIIHRLGVERYLNEAATAGLDGLIVPDLPVEESESLC